jgi:hypothetical protein
MPRQPRLDAPSTLHPVPVRGIERTRSFREDPDRPEFGARRAALTVDAGARRPNHAHLRIRTGARPLPRRHPGAERDRLSLGEMLGHPARPLAPVLGVRPQAV